MASIIGQLDYKTDIWNLWLLSKTQVALTSINRYRMLQTSSDSCFVEVQGAENLIAVKNHR